jgi:TRAP-type uncharacterized transport system fused permease subunit
MATVPTLLYYLSILLMIEADSRRLGTRALAAGGRSAGELFRAGGYHFTSLFAIAVFMVAGMSAFRAVFWATLLAVGLSMIRRETALGPRALAGALETGATGALGVVATTATAGIIVGVVTLTGLAQRFADIIIGYAQGSLVLTAIFTAAIVWVVGLAVPVTASYIMCAVIAAPALIKLGVPDFAAHMFIFYYAVLSEVSPPTALSPFAAAAITGGSPYKTTLQSWKYTMPAFLVPFVFVCDPLGVGLLLKIPKGGNWLDIVEIALETAAGIALLAFAFQGRFRRTNTPVETSLFIAAGLLFVFPAMISAVVKPLTGLDVEAYLPLLGGLGLHVGFNVILGALLGAAAIMMQRARPAVPA